MFMGPPLDVDEVTHFTSDMLGDSLFLNLAGEAMGAIGSEIKGRVEHFHLRAVAAFCAQRVASLDSLPPEHVAFVQQALMNRTVFETDPIVVLVINIQGNAWVPERHDKHTRRYWDNKRLRIILLPREGSREERACVPAVLGA